MIPGDGLERGEAFRSTPHTISFVTTLAATPIWLGLLTAASTEVNPAGVVVYGLLLLVLAPVSAYATSLRVAPWAERATWPAAPPWGGMLLAAIGMCVVAVVEYWYWQRLSHGGGSSIGVMLWYLVFMLAPPMFCGCIAHLAFAAITQRSAG